MLLDQFTGPTTIDVTTLDDSTLSIGGAYVCRQLATVLNPPLDKWVIVNLQAGTIYALDTLQFNSAEDAAGAILEIEKLEDWNVATPSDELVAQLDGIAVRNHADVSEFTGMLRRSPADEDALRSRHMNEGLATDCG